MSIVSYDIFRKYEKTSWAVKDLQWQSLDRDEVLPEYVSLARSAVMGECNSIAAMHGFLNESEDDYEFAAFASLWGYEELRHHYAFRAWLHEVGDPVEELPVAETRAPYPPGNTHAATLATNIISELTVFRVYRDLSEQVQEPVLAEILRLASADEARHANSFARFTRLRLASHPEELSSVLETLYFYVADPRKTIKHPVSVFKGEHLESYGKETIDDGFAYFLSRGDSATALRDKILSVFSTLTGFDLDSPKSVRRALAKVLH